MMALCPQGSNCGCQIDDPAVRISGLYGARLNVSLAARRERHDDAHGFSGTGNRSADAIPP